MPNQPTKSSVVRSKAIQQWPSPRRSVSSTSAHDRGRPPLRYRVTSGVGVELDEELDVVGHDARSPSRSVSIAPAGSTVRPAVVGRAQSSSWCARWSSRRSAGALPDQWSLYVQSGCSARVPRRGRRRRRGGRASARSPAARRGAPCARRRLRARCRTPRGCCRSALAPASPASDTHNDDRVDPATDHVEVLFAALGCRDVRDARR